MKKIISVITLLVITMTQYSFAQDSTGTSSNTILNVYLKVKDALVASNVSQASENAGKLITAIEQTSTDILAEDVKTSLLKEAKAISQSKDLKQQRDKFAGLSEKVAGLAKSKKLSAEPLYLMTCPMKKASWLSSEKAIKNPYFGNAMLTCGAVTATY